jgi:hypothetical protein
MDIQYGKSERITKMDDNGSVMIESATLHDGVETDVKTRFEIRVRVTSEKDVLTQFLQWRSDTKFMTKAEFRIEHTAIGNKEGYFYVVKCWTEINKR